MANEQKSVEVVELDVLDAGAFTDPEKKHYHNDAADMRRMGKRQQFQRNFQFLSIAAFSVVAISGWCYTPSTTTYGLFNGGSGGLIIMFLVNFIGLFFVVISLAEMSAIAPTAGGQYHWASEFAPPNLQRVASYLAGWLSSISWSAGFAAACYLQATTFQGLILVNNPGYVPQPWQAWLFVVSIVTFGLAVNTLLARHLPRLEGLAAIFFTLAFISIMVVLWVMAPRRTAAQVFGDIHKGVGWSSLGESLLAGQSAIMFLIVGSDATAHMAEETKDAAVVVPKAMITSYIINGGLSFVMLVTYCFLLVDYGAAEASPVGELYLPYIQVFINAVNSVGGGTAIIAIMTSVQIIGNCNWMASDARQIFAFARDYGLPFGDWIAKVNATGTYPVNSILVVWAFVSLITLITLGSTIAFTALTSLQIIALIFTYLISLSSILWRRFFGSPLPSSAWTLGRAAIPMNVLGWCYCIYLLIFLPWPVAVPVTLENFNWASVMFVGIMFLALLYFVFYARKKYKGPVALVRPREE